LVFALDPYFNSVIFTFDFSDILRVTASLFAVGFLFPESVTRHITNNLLTHGGIVHFIDQLEEISSLGLITHLLSEEKSEQWNSMVHDITKKEGYSYPPPN
jgi:hypothetical protein